MLISITLGPSSNHAFFRALSGGLAHTARISSPSQQHSMASWARSHHTRTQTRASSPVDPRSASTRLDQQWAPQDAFVLPRERDAIPLMNRFFATVGLVLPILSRTTLVSEYNQARRSSFSHVRRDFLALLNIVWAHASSSIQTVEAETFYQRALAVLDERSMQGTSVELSKKASSRRIQTQD